MKKFLSRWTIAWLLSAVMTVSVVPVPVFAEDGQTANEPVIESELPVEETDSVAEETDSVTETEDSATDGTEPVVEGTEHVEEETEPVVEETEPVEEEIEPVAEEAPETVAPAEEESAVQKLQAEIDELPTLDEFKEMEPSEHEEFLEKANMLYEQACELSDEDYLALDLTKIEELLTYEGPAAELFALKPNQRLVSSEAELEYAIATAEGTREEPTEILLENDITLTSTLNIVDKFVTLAPFGTERVKITAASKFQVANARMIIVGDGTGEAYLGARKIDFVGSGNDENKYAILLSNANTDVELTNCKLTGGYSPDVTHGAGAMIYGDATFDGVEIYDNYGYRCGGLYTQAGANVHFMNGSIHDNAISLDYAGGVYVNGTGYIRIENSSIYGNSANSGSAIFSAGVVDLDNVSIYENKKCESIFVTNWGNDNTLTVNDCTFRDNENGDISPSAIKDLFVEGNTQMAISASLNDNLKVRGLGTDARIVVEHPAEISADSAYVLTETDLNAFEMKTEGYTLYLDTEANAIKSAAATTIIFHANNGTDTTATQAVPSGIATVLDANTFTAPDGKVFAGWNTKADGSGTSYADCASVSFTDANTTLFAQWSEKATVKNQAELKDAFNNASTDSAKPSIIKLGDNFSLTETITLETGRYVKINGNGKKIIRDTAFNGTNSKMFKVSKNSVLTLENVVLDGGAVWSDTYSEDKDVSDIIFSTLGHGTTNNGIYNSDAILYVEGNVVLNNGAVIQNNDGSTTNMGVASAEDALFDSRGIYINGAGTVTMNDGAEVKNCLSKFGAGIYVTSGGSFVMNGGTISGNASTRNTAYSANYTGGGAIRAWIGKVYINGGKIKNNVAMRDGGAICVNDDGANYLEIKGGHIYNNYAVRNGGGICFANSGVNNKFIGGLIESNKCSGQGAGAWIGFYAYSDIGGSLVVKDNYTTNGVADNFNTFGIKSVISSALDGADVHIAIRGKFAEERCLNAGPGYTITKQDLNKLVYDNEDEFLYLDLTNNKVLVKSLTELTGFCGPKDENGNFTDSATWAFNPATGVLTISGEGAMASWTDDEAGREAGADTRPWAAFVNDIKEIIVSEGVTTIGENAFWNTTNCKKVTLPENSLTEMKRNAFRKCGLEEAVIPDSVTTVGNNIFTSCSNIKTVKIGTGIESTAACMFDMWQDDKVPNTTLQTVTLPAKVKAISDCTFRNCSGLQKVISLADSLTVNEAGAYSIYAENCGSLTVTKNFSGCIYVGKEDATVETNGNTVTVAKLNGGTIPADTVFEEGKLAIPEKAGSAFGGWYNNPNFSGTAVTDAEPGKTYYAKWASGNELSGICGDPNVNDGKNVQWKFDPATGTLTISGEGAMADTMWGNEGDIAPWKDFRTKIVNCVIEEGVTSISASALRETKITSVNLPSTIEKIGNAAFYNISTMSGGLTIPVATTKIDGWAFANAKFSGDLTILSSSVELEDTVFYNSNLTGTLDLTKFSGDTIKSQNFEGNRFTGKLVIPSGVNKIEQRAFTNNNFTSVVAETSTLTLDTQVFEGCNNIIATDLTKVTSLDFRSGNNQLNGNAIYVGSKAIADKVNEVNNGTIIHYDSSKTAVAVTNGGTFPADTVFKAGKLATPVNSGHIFVGWFTDDACTTSAPESIGAGATYYAKWDEAKEFTATAEGYKGEYDGEFHTVTITPSEEGATILYSADNGKTYSDKAPQYKNSGEYVVYYKVQKAGYMDVTGSVQVIIDKIPNPVTITPSSEKVTGGKTVKFTITAPDGVTINGITATLDGVPCEEITVTKNDDGTFSAVMPTKTGTYTFTVDASGDKINNCEDATCTVTVKKKTTSDGGSGSGGSSGSIGSSATKPVVGTAISPVDETTKAEAAKTDANKAATKADNADNTLTLVSQNGTTVFGKDFSQPTVLSIPVSTKGVEDVNDLTIAKLDPENGKLEIVGGSYNAEAEAVVGYITEAGDYFVVNKDDLITIVLQIGSYPAKVNNVDKILDAAPILSQDRTMVPLRFVAETFGAKVEWLEATRTIVITVDGKVLTMTIGKELEGFGAAPVISDSRTMVPINYISTELGAKVVWVPSTKTVSIAK